FRCCRVRRLSVRCNACYLLARHDTLHFRLVCRPLHEEDRSMTNGNGYAPSAITGDTYAYPSFGAVPLQIAVPYLLSPPNYTDLPRYWSWQRDVALAATTHREDMWSSAVARTATKFAAHGFTIRDSKDSTLRVKNAQALLKQA